MAQIELSKAEIECLLEFFDLDFIPYIKSDNELDNMKYLISMCEVYKKLETALDEVKNEVRNEDKNNV